MNTIYYDTTVSCSDNLVVMVTVGDDFQNRDLIDCYDK